MSYQAPVEEICFCLDHMIRQGPLAPTVSFPELEEGTQEAILEEAGRTFVERVSPAREADIHDSVRLENGVVRTPQAFHNAYAALREGGWIGASASVEYGGMGLPQYLNAPIGEILGSSCTSFSLCPTLTQGTILALEIHGTEEQKAAYLPHLVSGEWSGTMNLTESHAGSDVGSLRTRAAPNGDGSFAITGEKTFISWGDCDFTSNVIHMVLARTPDSPAGTRGISLFLVPKILLDENGNPGTRNSLKPLALENKVGLHGSPTAMMSYEGAKGWLIGDEHAGMACMFTMMNAARLGVGIQGIAIAEAARQLASAYALERHQGVTPEGKTPIIGHADVRRMIMDMRARTEAARAICYDLGRAIDFSRRGADSAQRKQSVADAAFLTPIAKAFASDTGFEVASTCIQVHGGTGYMEATGAGRMLCDARIAMIYEGTNGIQALDLVARKVAPDSGKTARRLLDEVEATIAGLEAAKGDHARITKRARSALKTAHAVTAWLVEASDIDQQAGATAYLRLYALIRGMHHLGKAVLAAPDNPTRVATATFYAGRVLPEVQSLGDSVMAGAEVLYEISAELATA